MGTQSVPGMEGETSLELLRKEFSDVLAARLQKTKERPETARALLRICNRRKGLGLEQGNPSRETQDHVGAASASHRCRQTRIEFCLPETTRLVRIIR